MGSKVVGIICVAGHLLEESSAIKPEGDKLVEYVQGVCYRLIDPGCEFRFHREWYVRSAMRDLLGEDDSLAQSDRKAVWEISANLAHG